LKAGANKVVNKRGLLTSFKWSSIAATDKAIRTTESALGVSLPTDYRRVLGEHDGGEGWVGDGAFLRLWPVTQLVEKNRELEANRLLPGVVLIGTDGGGELYAIETKASAYKRYPAVGLSRELGAQLGNSWDEFLAALAEMR
jgi:hypothetical protein